jgi:hypothetical protein
MEKIIRERHAEMLRSAYLFARGERLAELRGQRYHKYDGRGLHTLSMIWGEVQACELLVPGLVSPSPVEIRQRAQAEARSMFIREVITQSTEEAGNAQEPMAG